jgi:hypothetical protein
VNIHFQSPSARFTSTVASAFQEQIWTASEVHPSTHSYLVVQDTRLFIGASEDADNPKAIFSRSEGERGNGSVWVLVLG